LGERLRDGGARRKDNGPATRMPSNPAGPAPGEELKQAVMAGREVRRGCGEPAEQGHSWGEDRQLPADLLSELLVRAEGAAEPGAAVLVGGLRITGRLNLEATKLQVPLFAHSCYFDQPVNLTAAKAREISLTACHLPGLASNRLETRGDLSLAATSTRRSMSLERAHVAGRLDLEGATLADDEGPALSADGLRVDGDMLCRSGFSAQGELRLVGARLGTQLDLQGATLSNHRGPALSADGLLVDGDMLCRVARERPFSAHGEVRLVGAHIGGRLGLEGRSLANEQGPALVADGLRVEGDMCCGGEFSAHGEVRLVGAHIGGRLRLEGASLTDDGGPALVADGLRVDPRWDSPGLD
jgi:hypothetical protein